MKAPPRRDPLARQKRGGRGKKRKAKKKKKKEVPASARKEGGVVTGGGLKGPPQVNWKSTEVPLQEKKRRRVDDSLKKTSFTSITER